MLINVMLLMVGVCSSAVAQLPGGFVRDGGDIKVGGQITVTNIIIATGSTVLAVSTAGIVSPGNVDFSSNVVITGELTVKSAKTRALHVPAGGLIVGEDQADIAPGHIRAKEVKVSTLTLKGSAIFFVDDNEVPISTMTSTSLDLNGNIRGRIQMRNSGSGPPPEGNCNAGTLGTWYESTTQPKLYYCRQDQTWGVLTMTAAP